MRKQKTPLRLAKALLSLALAAVTAFSSSAVADAATLGIDVSRYQGAVDWKAVSSAGVSFAFVRAGTTKSGVDSYFAANVQGAQAAGIRTGVYIYSYADSVEGAINDANLVLQWIEGYNINLPVAFDIEDKVQKALPPATVTAMCNAFGDVIAAAGYRPIICTYKNFYLNNMIPAEIRHDLWIAQYASSCDIPNAAVWQASSEGSIPGILGNVDIDYMFKDYASLILPMGFAAQEGGVYFYNNYRRQFGWVNYNNMRYHMDAFGRMNTGWFSDESGTYYLAADGHALTGYQAVNGANHYFSADGAMQVGQVAIGGGVFYFDPATGAQQNGFIGDLANRYYYNAYDGSMATGLQAIDGRVYNFGTNGKMLFGWQKVGSANYYFNPADGAMVTGLISQADGIYGASQVDGHQLVNEIALIDNVPRCFDGNGRMVAGASYQIGNVVYRCDANGVAAIAIQ